jgi:hypothetical protein
MGENTMNVLISGKIVQCVWIFETVHNQHSYTIVFSDSHDSLVTGDTFQSQQKTIAIMSKEQKQI